MEPTRPSLSEISHLFLSQLRHGHGRPRPHRLPPGSPRPAATVCPKPLDPIPLGDHLHVPGGDDAIKQVSAVIASHLSGDYRRRIGQYARCLAHHHGSIGLIELAENECSLSCFQNGECEPTEAEIVQAPDATRLAQTLGEMSFDVKRWLISIADPTSDAARELLGQIPHWVLICTADNDGVVSAYRALKGLSEGSQPGLSLLVMDAASPNDALNVYRKLAGVSRQFLDYQLEREPLITPVNGVTQQLLLHWRATAEPSATAINPHWQTVADFVENSREPEEPAAPTAEPFSPAPAIAGQASAFGDYSRATRTDSSLNLKSQISNPQSVPHDDDLPQVIELPADANDDAAALQAILHQPGQTSRWIECPIKPPMFPSSMLAVGGDHKLCLWAIAGNGLCQLPKISQAYHWLSENRELLSQAFPQLSIDTKAMPVLRLLVDHTNAAAQLLQPLLHSERVTIETYRKLRWGQRTGLLLEAV